MGSKGLTISFLILTLLWCVVFWFPEQTIGMMIGWLLELHGWIHGVREFIGIPVEPLFRI